MQVATVIIAERELGEGVETVSLSNLHRVWVTNRHVPTVVVVLKR